MGNQRHIEKHERAACEIVVNGQSRSWHCEPRTTLLDFLRNQPGLQGTHAGCEHGVCGACTVLINGLPARACLAFAHQCSGQEVGTIEGMANADALTDLQQAFSRHHALQCGFCTPGILISAEHLLREQPDPSEQQVREALSGHLCRCTGYAGIVQAVLEVAKLRERKLRSGGQ
jgi:2-furoyl-CoA dehydrogenase 2Fe-2S iron sulfur subunit